MNPSTADTPDAGETGISQRKGGSDWVSFEEEESPRVNIVNEDVPKVASETALRKDELKLSVSRDSVEKNKTDTDNAKISMKKGEQLDNVRDKTSAVDRGAPAVISAETVHVNLDRSLNRIAAGSESPGGVPPVRVSQIQPLSTVDLASSNGASGRDTDSNPTGSAAGGITSLGISGGSSIREGFVNGDIIVTLLPVNTKWPWITPAQFRPELVPEELMAQGLTLTVEDYVSAMETLTNDVRFHAYNACYKRVLVAWICAAFAVLLALLFSGIKGLTLFGLGILWLLLNAAAIFLCMWLKIKLNHNLERCLAQVNKQLLRHRILLGLDDRGKLSCHKVNLCFIYFDTMECIRKLQEVIATEERDGDGSNSRQQDDEQQSQQQREFQMRMDIEDHDIIIQGSRTTRISRKQARAEMLLLRYSQRWAKAFLQHRLDLKGGNPPRNTQQDNGGVNPSNSELPCPPASSPPASTSSSFPPIPPRHCLLARCPCQFIEEHLRYKIPREACSICDLMRDPHYMMQ